MPNYYFSNGGEGSGGDDSIFITGTGGGTIRGLYGNDTLVGNDGNDILIGGPGIDRMWGGAGDDTYYIDEINDYIHEGSNKGNDTVYIELLRDSTWTSSGHIETIIINSPGYNVNIIGHSGTSETIRGNNGNNSITGNGGGDIIYGGAGNDILRGGSGIDTIYGGTGDDTIRLDSDGDTAIEYANQGNDTLEVIFGNYSNFYLSNYSNFENLIFSAPNSGRIVGTDENNVITSGGGNQIIDGGAGDDTMTGGRGNDTYIVDSSSDIVIEHNNTTQNNSGTADTVQSSTLSLDLANYDNVENLALTGSSNLNLTGNSENNTLTGNSGVNTLTGGAGDDTYVVANSSDNIIENDGEGTDTVKSSVDFTLGNYIENITLTGSSDINATGNSLNNILNAEQATGDIVLSGAGGNDTYYLNRSTSEVKVVEDNNRGNDHVFTSANFNVSDILGAGYDYYVETVTLTGSTGYNNFSGINEGVYSQGSWRLSPYGWGTGNIDDIVYGSSIANSISTGVGNDTAYGYEGNDTFHGVGFGTKNWYGGAGDDTYNLWSDSYAANNVYFSGALNYETTYNLFENLNEGTDTVRYAGRDNDTYTLTDNIENLTLTASYNSNGTGNALDNTITGNSGINIIDGGSGDDTLFGGAGEDTIYGGSGDDVIYGGDESSIILGEKLYGGDGNDIFFGGTGNNYIWSGNGNDTIVFDKSSSINSISDFKRGEDKLLFDATIFTSLTEIYDTNIKVVDITYPRSISNSDYDSDDYLIYNKSKGELWYDKDGSGTQYSKFKIAELEYDGTNYINDLTVDDIFVSGSEILYGNSLANTIDGSQENDAIYGRSGDDTITGGAGNDILDGGAGNDTLDGGAGNDTLDGGSGNDILRGGTGDDTYIIDSTSDTVTENSGEGTDTVKSSTISLDASNYSNVENFTLTGSSNLDLTGGSGNETLTGNIGANILDGGSGDDTLIGGAGNDIYIVDSTSDTVTENSGEGIDTVRSSSISLDLSDYSYIENAWLTGSSALNITGNFYHNTLYGNDGNNTIDGDAGSDAIYGFDGVDTLIGGSGNDALFGGAGSDTLDGGSGSDTLNGGLGSDIFKFSNIPTSIYTYDTVQDFSTDDKIYLDENVFTDLEEISNDNIANASSYLYGQTLAYLDDDIKLIFDTTNRDLYYDQNTSNYQRSWVKIAEFNQVGSNNVSSLSASNFDDGSETLYGTSLADTIDGGRGNDTIYGRAGDDTIIGGSGSDILYGEAGGDTFVFNSLNGVDQIKDFVQGDDLLKFDSSVFTELTSINQNNIKNGTSSFLGPGYISADNEHQHLIFEQNTGDLYYDPDPMSFLSEKIKIANIDNLSSLKVSDIFGAKETGTAKTIAHKLSNNVTKYVDGAIKWDSTTLDVCFANTSNGTDTYFDSGSGTAYPYEYSIKNFSTSEKNMWKEALNLISNVTNLEFNYVNDGEINSADLRFFQLDNLAANAGFAGLAVHDYGLEAVTGKSGSDFADIYIDSSDLYMKYNASVANGYNGKGSDAFYTVLHETVHALGMGHAHDNGFGSKKMPGAGKQNAGKYDTNYGYNSVTSYNQYKNGLVNQPSDVALYGFATLGAWDIFALQQKYGVNTSYNNTDTIYNLNDYTFGYQSIWDAGGTDTFVYDGSSNANLDLRQASLSITDKFSTGGYWNYTDSKATSGISISKNTYIENATGGSGNDSIKGNSGNNTLTGNSGNDKLYGYSGSDTLNGGSGNDIMYGGSGNDTYVVNSTLDKVYEGKNSGTDTIQSSLSTTDLKKYANVENITLLSAGKAIGNTSNNIITGSSGNDKLYGSSGTDRLVGNEGNDYIDGGSGNDTMIGGVGNDTYRVNSKSDTVTENSSEGTDTVQSSNLSLNLLNYSNVENITLLGKSKLSATGNDSNNTLKGNIGNNTLNGKGGTDTLIGGKGNDTFIFDLLDNANGNWTYLKDFEAKSMGNDTIKLDKDIFTSLKVGKLAKKHFLKTQFYQEITSNDIINSTLDFSGLKGQGREHYIIYNRDHINFKSSDGGVLYYDEDGAGGNDPIPFATFKANATVNYDDIYIIA